MEWVQILVIAVVLLPSRHCCVKYSNFGVYCCAIQVNDWLEIFSGFPLPGFNLEWLIHEGSVSLTFVVFA